MPQVSAQEFERLPLRVHDFLAGVPLHDVWVVDLPRTRPGITLEQFARGTDGRLFRPSSIVRALLALRFAIGRPLGWDREPGPDARETFATRLTNADIAKSLAPAGTPQGLFRVVYRFENEHLLEVVNRTVHAAALSALVVWLPVVFWRLRTQCRPADASLHGDDRSVPQADRLPVAAAKPSRHVESYVCRLNSQRIAAQIRSLDGCQR